MNYTEYALIVAGGKGTRINSGLAKQFLELNGLPVLMHTLQAFYRYNEKIRIILVLSKEDLDTWTGLCDKHAFHKPLVIQHGGDTRFQSVKNGLDKIEGEGLVAIHDGVRPMITETIIRESFRIAATQDSAVATVPLKESIRLAQINGTSKAMDRSAYRLIQTPQTFRVSMIKQAYRQPEDHHLTDDASIAERAGFAVTLFEGSYENIKITTAEDLVMVEALMKKKERSTTMPK